VSEFIRGSYVLCCMLGSCLCLYGLGLVISAVYELSRTLRTDSTSSCCYCILLAATCNSALSPYSVRGVIWACSLSPKPSCAVFVFVFVLVFGGFRFRVSFVDL
jgi:hypothetical protein